MNPSVSVIIPTKNRAHFLDLALTSVLNQTFEDFEILVIDAASEDGTKEVVSKFDDKRISYIYKEKDPGVSATRNIGINLSKGRFITFLDDDDLWLPRKLEKQLKFMKVNSAMGGVCTGSRIIDENGNVMGLVIIPPDKNPNFLDLLKKNYIGNCSGMLLRRECFRKVGLFDERLPASEDYDMWVRIAKYYEIGCLREPLFLYRVHKTRLTTNAQAKLRAGILLYRKFWEDLQVFDNHGELFARWHYGLGLLYCESGNINDGRNEFLIAIRRDPHCFIYYPRLISSFFGFKIYTSFYRLLSFLIPSHLLSVFL